MTNKTKTTPVKESKEKSSKANHGGRRPGAGRSTIYKTPVVTRSISVPPHYLAFLKRVDATKGGVSNGVRKLIEQAVESDPSYAAIMAECESDST